MSSSPEPSPAPGVGADAELLLRVQRPGEPVEEVFVQPGLQLGRTPDNNIVIEDERVARHHAEVVEERGQYVLRCMPGASVEVENQGQTSEVVLVPGVRFRLGPAEIECCAAEQAQPREPVRRWDRCPSCGREEGLAVKPDVQRCPGCGREVVVLEDTERARVVLLARQGEQGEYVLERELGRGGMAWVWQGRRDSGLEAVAVKILMPRRAQEEGRRRRFAREWELLQQVRHPRVVPVLGHGEWCGELPYLVMPVLVGGSLQQVLNRPRVAGQPPCTFDEASVWFADVLEGLEALHKAGLVHRDIKPSNILLDETGHAVVADLGIAREVGAETEQTQATAPTGRLGTYLYMAPEQCENPPGVDRRADLFSVGATFYHLLTGHLPWGHYRPASEVNETVPWWFDRILNRLLAWRPEERYESVSAVREEWKRRLHPVGWERWNQGLVGASILIRRGWRVVLQSMLQQPAYWGVLLAGEVLVGVLCGALSGCLLGWLYGGLLGGAVGMLAFWLTKLVQALRGEGFDCRGAVGGLAAWLTRVVSRRGYSERDPEGVGMLAGWLSRVRSPAHWLFVGVGSGLGMLVGGFWYPLGDWRFGLMYGSVGGAFGGMGALVHWVCRGRPLGKEAIQRCLLGSVLGSVGSVLLLSWLPWVLFVAFGLAAVGLVPGARREIFGRGVAASLCFTGHEGQVRSVAVTPDGHYLVSGSLDGTVGLWELETGQEVRRFTGHHGEVRSVAVTPDGRYAVSGSSDKTVRVWELETGREVRCFTGHEEWVNCVAVTPDGRYVVSGSGGSWDRDKWIDCTVRVWELATGREVRRFAGHKDWVRSVLVTPDGRYVVSGSSDGTVRLWYIGDLM